MKRDYIDTPEGQVHYRTEGSGKPLLLLHQVGLSSDQFSEMIPILGKTCRVVAMDILGYGNSDPPTYEYKVEDYARSVIHFLDALCIKKTSVVGRLFGASLAVEIGAAYPARLDKLVLSSCIYLEQEAQQAWRSRYQYKRMAIKEDASHLIEWWRDRISRPNMKPEITQRALADYLRSGLGLTAEDGHRALFAYDMEPKLRLIKSSTLLLYGAGDIFLPRLEAIKKLLPRCQTKTIDGTHTYPTWEKPEEFAQAILEFLKRGTNGRLVNSP